MSEFTELFGAIQDERSRSDRVLLRAAESSAADPRPARPEMRTSVSIVLTDTSSVDEVERSFGGWDHDAIRAEVLIVGGPQGRGTTPLRNHLDRCGISHRVIEAPDGKNAGRAAMLAAAVEHAMHEVVVVASGVLASPEMINRALWWQWVDGADVALVPTHELDMVADEAEAATELAAWLGLGGSAGTIGRSRVVLLRRWVARWVFSELDRAISPAEELADRARLLGVSVVRLCNATTMTAQQDPESFEGTGGPVNH